MRPDERWPLAPTHTAHHAGDVLPSRRSRALACASGLCLFGCAAVKSGMQPSNDAAGGDAISPGPDSDGAASDTSSLVDRPPLDFGSPGERPPPAPGKVYAHSAETLFLLEPISKQVTTVGTFDCTGSMVDIAIDRNGKMTGSAGISFNGALGGMLVTVDPSNAHCTEL